ncbi:hypothetical protein M0804_005408 [Polistes exclamans]|nr:hypothetical protein M0804_005408 [Polistes exclamans]
MNGSRRGREAGSAQCHERARILPKMIEKFSNEDGDSFYSSNHYYKLIRRLSIFIGVWPYETGKWQTLRSYLTLFLTTLFLVGQIPAFFTMEYNIQTLAESLFIFGPTLCISLTYYIVNNGKINQEKEIFNHIKDDWSKYKTTRELTVIQEYAEKSRFNTQLLLLMCIMPIVVQILTSTLNYVSKNNVTNCELMVEIELFVINRKEHSCLTLFVCFILLSIQAALLIINVGYCQIIILHACGMFRIVGVILESLFDKKELCCFKFNEDVISATLNRAINHHNRVIKLVESTNLLMDLSCTFCTVFGTILFCTDLIMLLQFGLNKNNVNEFLTTLFYMGTIAFVTFLQCHIAQKLLDHSTDVFQETIIQPWYLLPPKYQKLSLLIMMRSMKQCSLIMGKMFLLSYDMFGKQMKMAVSYGLIFHSLNNN